MQEDADIDFCLGVHSGDHAIYPDCRPEFYEAIFKAFSIGNWESDKVHLNLPYLHMNKTDILRDAADAIEKLGLDFDTIFRNTCTSYQPDKDGKSHGLTGSDVERIIAFHEFGREDPVTYMDSWENVVCACLTCNVRKGGRTPQEAGMRLLKPPVKPTRSPLICRHLNQEKYASWRAFLKPVVRG